LQSGKCGQLTEVRAAFMNVDGMNRQYISGNRYLTVRSLTHRST
jgi:hypothetical protein